MLALLARARGSKWGALLLVVGVFALLATLVFGLVSVAGDAILMVTGVGPVIQFLGTGTGVLVGFGVSVFVILLGVAFLVYTTPQPTQSVSVIQQSGTSQAERDRELERLGKKLRRTEQELDRYRAIVSDPTAKRQREEEMLRKRCGDLALEVRGFAQAHKSQRYTDQQEAVERFRRRYYNRVEEAREELDGRGWLTDEERHTLTLSPQDGMDGIGRMADALGNIAVGR